MTHHLSSGVQIKSRKGSSDMCLAYGALNNANIEVANKHGWTASCDIQHKTITFVSKTNDCLYFTLSSVEGDCTVCTVELSGIPAKNVAEVFPFIQEMMSINARISCLFSKQVQRYDAVQPLLDSLKPLQIIGLHVQHSNRNHDKTWMQIAGILKVPNTVCKSYDRFEKATQIPEGFNLNDATVFNTFATKYNMPTL